MEDFWSEENTVIQLIREGSRKLWWKQANCELSFENEEGMLSKMEVAAVYRFDIVEVSIKFREKHK